MSYSLMLTFAFSVITSPSPRLLPTGTVLTCKPLTHESDEKQQEGDMENEVSIRMVQACTASSLPTVPTLSQTLASSPHLL